MRIHGYREICARFADAGFASCDGRAGLTDEPYRLGASRLLLVATRR